MTPRHLSLAWATLALVAVAMLSGCAGPRCDYYPDRTHFFSPTNKPREYWYEVEEGYCLDGSRRWRYGREVSREEAARRSR